jgi:hypothetical protein
MNIFWQAKKDHDIFRLRQELIYKALVQSVTAVKVEKKRQKIVTHWASRRLPYAALFRGWHIEI